MLFRSGPEKKFLPTHNNQNNKCNVQGRPMLPQTMEFITDMGTIFQSYVKDEITVDEFCTKAQEYVDKYSE